jgi:transmembrane sensor
MAVAVTASVLFWLNLDSSTPQRYATRHGEQRTWRLADDSVLRLNTDTAVTVRYGRAERLVEIDQGEALFEVAHESGRPFRVIAGTAVVTATGTQFDVYRQGDATLVTVIEGQVTVAPADATRTVVPVSAGEEVRVTAGVVAAPAPADIQRNTAWLRRQIVFKHQPLAAVAAEFNRYGAVPIEIETPALRTLAISGVFTADDTETFIAFLRTLEGVTVETTPTQIRVVGRITPAPVKPPAEH